MIAQILRRDNLLRALKQVQQNKGAAGVDRMSVDQLSQWMSGDYLQVVRAIETAQYVPQAILGVAIAKPTGGTRILGIPTVVDRLLQQAVVQGIMAGFEYEFSDYSYAFRPRKNLHQAVLKAQSYIHQGFQDIVDIDLKAFFDQVNHSLLMQLVYRKVKCKTTLRLIRKWLRAPMLLEGRLQKRRQGIPQGSPLSPLLSNILLHELDRELEKNEIRFVRYADDFSIYTKSKTEAKKIGNQIFLFLKNKLRLPINPEKSGIRRPVSFTVLGFGFVPTYKTGDKGKYQFTVGAKSWKRFKSSLKAITRKTSPMSFDERVRQINQVQRGWIQNFRLASMYSKIKELDAWVRMRLRYCIWHDWKRPERKRINLIRLGVKPQQAYAWSRSRKGGWAIAQSPILGTTITLERLLKRGYRTMLDLYLRISPVYAEPPYS